MAVRGRCQSKLDISRLCAAVGKQAACSVGMPEGTAWWRRLQKNQEPEAGRRTAWQLGGRGPTCLRLVRPEQQPRRKCVAAAWERCAAGKVSGRVGGERAAVRASGAGNVASHPPLATLLRHTPAQALPGTAHRSRVSSMSSAAAPGAAASGTVASAGTCTDCWCQPAPCRSCANSGIGACVAACVREQEGASCSVNQEAPHQGQTQQPNQPTVAPQAPPTCTSRPSSVQCSTRGSVRQPAYE